MQPLGQSKGGQKGTYNLCGTRMKWPEALATPEAMNEVAEGTCNPWGICKKWPEALETSGATQLIERSDLT